MYLLKFFYRKILVRVFTLCARYRITWPSIFLFPVYIRKIKQAERSSKSINILIIPKEGFNEDVLSCLGQDERITIYTIYRMVTKALAEGILHHSIDDNNYMSDDPDVQATKLAYRDYLSKLWIKLGYLYRFDAVLSGNFGYFAEHELAAALESRGVPFIILQKENLKTPGFMEFFSFLYRCRRGPFLGRRILVYNQIERQLEIDNGVITPDRVDITGMPRLDRIHAWRKSQATGVKGKPKVLFFSFGPKTGLPIMPRKSRGGVFRDYEKLPKEMENLHWEGLCRDAHEAMVRLAQSHPDVEIIIKTKIRERELSAMVEIIGRYEETPSNLKIVTGGDPLALIKESRVVCGFNTTALFESLAAGKPVVSPRFQEALDERMQPFIVDMEDAVEYAYSSDELIDILYRHAIDSSFQERDLDAKKKRILEKWVGNEDGLAGERVRRAVLEEIS